MTDIHASDFMSNREELRLEVLAASGLLAGSPERELASLLDLAERLLGPRLVFITLVDRDRLVARTAHQAVPQVMPREGSFCATVVETDDMLMVADARADPRFRDLSIVAGEPGVRSYLGVPIRARIEPDGALVPLGTVCLLDTAHHLPSEADVHLLRQLAELAEGLIRPRLVAMQAAELMVENRQRVYDLTRAHRQFHQAERMADIGSWRLSLDGHEMQWSDQVFAIYGLPLGSPPPVDRALDHYPVQSRALIVAALERAMKDGTPFDVELDFITASGEIRRVRSMGEMELIDGVPVALIGVFQDITARFHAEQELRRSAVIDELTRLTNRAGFTAQLDERISRAQAADTPLALLLIDLDGFKLVNDRYGHLAGDEVLKLVGRRLGAPHWADCAPARLGGDEFVLLLEGERDSAAFHIAVDQILSELCHVVEGDQGSIAVSGTVGISWMEPGCTRRDLLDRADQALYQAKRAQPGTARIFGEACILGRSPAWA